GRAAARAAAARTVATGRLDGPPARTPAPPACPRPATGRRAGGARLRRDPRPAAGPGCGARDGKEETMAAQDFVVVLVTAASAEEAAGIGDALVEARLVACANVIGPIRSIYRWQGAVERAEEHLLLLKGRADDLQAIDAQV